MAEIDPPWRLDPLQNIINFGRRKRTKPPPDGGPPPPGPCKGSNWSWCAYIMGGAGQYNFTCPDPSLGHYPPGCPPGGGTPGYYQSVVPRGPGTDRPFEFYLMIGPGTFTLNGSSIDNNTQSRVNPEGLATIWCSWGFDVEGLGCMDPSSWYPGPDDCFIGTRGSATFPPDPATIPGQVPPPWP